MQNKAWQEAGVASVPMAVNLSANQICSNVLVEQVSSILEETGLSPSYLELEITERTVISEMKRIKDELERLKKLGVRIAIDDFGTGFSSMQYLRELPVDLIKIPIDFVHGIDNNVKDESIISVILTLAASLDLEVIAEGVETKNQLNFLLDRMCNNIQGFYFSKPMRAKNIVDFCQKNREKTFFAS
jgi:EAL domain-containing protein (putative c-di-GMP-specific phosphodiesterase class I)